MPEHYFKELELYSTQEGLEPPIEALGSIGAHLEDPVLYLTEEGSEYVLRALESDGVPVPNYVECNKPYEKRVVFLEKFKLK